MVIKIIKEFIEFLGDFLGKEDTLSRIGVSQIGWGVQEVPPSLRPYQGRIPGDYLEKCLQLVSPDFNDKYPPRPFVLILP